MIKIKNYIFNENEIREIKQCKNYLRLDLTYSGPYLHIDDANYEDIEWNYGTQKRTQEHKIRKGVCDKNKKPLLTIEDIQLYIQELEEENKKLRKQLLNYQMPPHNQNYYWTTPFEITCTAKGEDNENN